MTSKSAQAVPAALAVVVLSLLAFVPSALASRVISEPGKGAGQTRGPNGVAVDFETGRLYVADTENNRVEVFSPTGVFERAFGWGVKDGEGKFEVCTTSCREGLSGSGAGEFDEPTSIAVDNSPGSSSRHDVYVVDSANGRIEKFTPEGEFALVFGSAGEGEGQFSSGVVSTTGLSDFFVGVGSGGTVYVLDSLKAGSEFEQRLQKFEPSGAVIAPQHMLYKSIVSALSLAVDSAGDFYIDTGFSIRRYNAGGGFVEEIQNAFEGTFEGAPTIGVQALAVGAEDNLFAVSWGLRSEVSVMEFDSAGDRLRRFGYGSVHFAAKPIAPSPEPKTGGVYIGEFFTAGNEESVGNRVVQTDLGPAGPVVFPTPCSASPLGSVKATLNAEVNPEGKAATVHFQYITDADFVANGNSFSGTRPAISTAESGSVGSDFTLHKASAAVRLEPETKYHCRAVATNADAPAGIDGEEGIFLSREPFEFLEISASGVGTETATLNATVNPLGTPTDGYFEYVDDATYQKDVADLGPGHGFDHAGRAPQASKELDFGAGEEPKAVSASVSGLLPGTLYHFRIRVDDHLPTVPPRSGPEGTFRTFAPLAGLPDDRAWELVSPVQKDSAEVAVPGTSGGLSNKEVTIPIDAAAGSGQAVTYTSWTSFGDPEGAPSASQYLSKRTPSGWSTENVSPFGFIEHPLMLPYRGFTPDLRFGAFVIDEPALTPEAKEGFPNLYLRDNETGAVQALTIEAPQTEGVSFCSGYAGASADGTHAIFSGRGAMTGTGAPVGEGFSLYEWSAGKGLALVSVLPGGEPAPLAPASKPSEPHKGTDFGDGGGDCTADQAPIRNAISKDGSVIFWHYGGKYKNSEQPLFARIDGTETVQLDAKSPGEKNGGGGIFWAATGDGSEAFFTAPGKLTKDAGAAGQIYRYDTESRSLVDLTPGAVAPEVEGVIGASEDGSYVYFVGGGALSGEQENVSHEKAVQGANNLYVWHEGEGVRFIARLSALDSGDWSKAPETLIARVTPDGRSLAFLSVEAQALSGYDNTIAVGGYCQPGPNRSGDELQGDPHCPEAYLYDAESDTLSCASCNPSGSRPIGPVTLPGWSNPYEGPRYLSDDGSRLFFESRDALSAADQNDRRDVYEFERPGAGSCTSKGPAFDATSGGCIFLISSGKSTDETFLVDASADGRDVFFSTRRSLTGGDTNENYDVYDARVGGGFAEPRR